MVVGIGSIHCENVAMYRNDNFYIMYDHQRNRYFIKTRRDSNTFQRSS